MAVCGGRRCAVPGMAQRVAPWSRVALLRAASRRMPSLPGLGLSPPLGQCRDGRAAFLRRLLTGYKRDSSAMPTPEPRPPTSQTKWDYQAAVTVQQLVPFTITTPDAVDSSSTPTTPSPTTSTSTSSHSSTPSASTLTSSLAPPTPTTSSSTSASPTSPPPSSTLPSIPAPPCYTSMLCPIRLELNAPLLRRPMVLTAAAGGSLTSFDEPATLQLTPSLSSVSQPAAGGQVIVARAAGAGAAAGASSGPAAGAAGLAGDSAVRHVGETPSSSPSDAGVADLDIVQLWGALERQWQRQTRHQVDIGAEAAAGAGAGMNAGAGAAVGSVAAEGMHGASGERDSMVAGVLECDVLSASLHGAGVEATLGFGSQQMAQVVQHEHGGGGRSGGSSGSSIRNGGRSGSGGAIGAGIVAVDGDVVRPGAMAVKVLDHLQRSGSVSSMSLGTLEEEGEECGKCGSDEEGEECGRCGEDGDEAPGYRTADRVSVVCVPSLKQQGRWKVMVEKSSVYNTKEEGMDSFKYAASLNEWETWSRHWELLSSCPNLVQLHGIRRGSGTIQIYSEFCQGGDLQELLRGTQGLGMATVQTIAHDVLSGLSALHGAGLVYGDLKPSNVFTGGSEDNPQYKIGDYGTMREVGRKHLHYFVSGFGFTPEYAPPEILERGTMGVGPQSDVWSFGVMLHELATGKLPDVAVEFKRLHEGEFPDASARRRRYLRSQPLRQSLAASMQGLPEGLRHVIHTCMAEEPAKRPRTAVELVRSCPWLRDEQAQQQQQQQQAGTSTGLNSNLGSNLDSSAGVASAEFGDWQPPAPGWAMCWGGQLVEWSGA